MDTNKQFSSPQEEIDYWKKIAQDYKISLEETKEELDEFQVGSRELEIELEAQLEQAEKKTAELTSAHARLQMENEMLREKLEKSTGAMHMQISELSDDLAQVRAFKDELQKYIRELEQANDDLERAKRATVVSLEDFEARLNHAIERNAFLESELEEKDTLATTVQRLKDEARDLRDELAVTNKDKDPLVSPVEQSPTKIPDNEKGKRVPPTMADYPIDSNKLAENGEIITQNTTPSQKTFHNHMNNGTPLTPSARISALNIVGDLLRKVGALESKLASCRNFVKDPPRNNKPGSTSPINSPRAKRIHRGVSAPSQPSAPSQQGYGVKITV